MKKVTFTYLLGGSIELIVKARISDGGSDAIIKEVYDADTCKPFDTQWITIQASEFPFRSIPIHELFINMAIEKAKEVE